MTDQEREKLYTLRWTVRERWGQPAEKDECLKILGELLGEKPATTEPPGPEVPVNKGRKLWLSAGHGGSDPGITAHGRSEADCAIELRDLIKARLVGYDVWTDPNSWKTSTTAPYLQTNTRAGDVICDLHWNGFNGVAKGVEVIVPVSYTSFEKALAQRLAKAIADVTGSPLRGDAGMRTESESQHGRLAMMRPAGENVLIEVCFLDNKAEMDSYLSKKSQVATAIATVLEQFLTS